MKFTWDAAKRDKVLAEHKVDFDKITDIFNDPFAVEDIDEIHSTAEETRFTIIGLTREYGLVFLAFTELSETNLRFITARKAESWMTTIYDKARSRR
ncbi:MAG: BrnT family toxin [Pyrinomonadaceae bacterium]